MNINGDNNDLAAMYGPWASPCSQLLVALRRVNSDTVSVLCRERFWVEVDLKRRYRNSLSK